MDSELKRVEMLIEEALALLDGINAPSDIGAHVDLALNRIREIGEKMGLKGPADRN